MTTPTEAIAALVPHVDRLALCVHRPAGTDPELRAAIDALHIPAGSMIVVAARHLVRDGMRPGDLAALSRYQPRSWLAASEQDHVERGLLLERSDGVLTASPAFRDLAALVLDVQARVVADLWGDPKDAASTVSQLVASVTDAATDGAFRRQVECRPPTPHAAAELLAAVTELRYLRADAHAAALDAAGVRPKDAIELTKRWKGFGDPLPPEDVARRAGIEDDTNRRVAEQLPADDVAALLDLVTELPGDDPRPIEDR